MSKSIDAGEGVWRRQKCYTLLSEPLLGDPLGKRRLRSKSVIMISSTRRSFTPNPCGRIMRRLPRRPYEMVV